MNRRDGESANRRGEVTRPAAVSPSPRLPVSQQHGGGDEARLQGEGEVTRAANAVSPSRPLPDSQQTPTPHSLHVPLTVDEIGLHHWTSRAAKLKLRDYLRSALDEKARRVVTDLGSRGKKIPPWVAKLLDR